MFTTYRNKAEQCEQALADVAPPLRHVAAEDVVREHTEEEHDDEQQQHDVHERFDYRVHKSKDEHLCKWVSGVRFVVVVVVNYYQREPIQALVAL